MAVGLIVWGAVWAVIGIVRDELPYWLRLDVVLVGGACIGAGACLL